MDGIVIGGKQTEDIVINLREIGEMTNVFGLIVFVTMEVKTYSNHCLESGDIDAINCRRIKV